LLQRDAVYFRFLVLWPDDCPHFKNILQIKWTYKATCSVCVCVWLWIFMYVNTCRS